LTQTAATGKLDPMSNSGLIFSDAAARFWRGSDSAVFFGYYYLFTAEAETD